MIKLRTVLLYDKLYYLLVIIALLITMVNIFIPKSSKYVGRETKIIGKITNIYRDGNFLELEIYSKEKLICNYYFKTKKELENFDDNFLLGDKISLKGKMIKPPAAKTKNIFDYQKYLKHKKIYYLFKIEDYKKLASSQNIYYKLKQFIIKRINKNPYLYTFILGEKKYMEDKVVSSFQNNGISHLFAISGMHINLLGMLLLKLLTKLKVKEEKRYLCISIILLFYMTLTGISPSILRGVLFFIFFSLNKVFYLYIKNTNIFLTTLAISLLINSEFIYDVGFWYSFSISITLLAMSDFINRYKNYFTKLLITSILSFIISIPITLYHFYQFNLLSIIYNLFYVPFISILLFPLSLITFLFRFLDPLYNIFIGILEKTSLYLDQIKIATFIFPKTYKIIYILYFLFIIILFISIKKKHKKSYIPLCILLLCHYFYPYIDRSDYIKMIDVGQGDSFLLHSNNKNILIDTGGVFFYKKEKWQERKDENSIVKNTTIPLLKSLGIKRIDYLLLTHGDYDHVGETINLLEYFQIQKIYI